MTRSRITRRQLLRGAGGIAIALPWLDMFEGTALAATPPRRLIIVHTGIGTYLEKWKPTGTETAFALSPILSPLAAHRDKLLIVDHLANAARLARPLVRPHPSAAGTVLTGTEVLPDGTGAEDSYSWAGGISVDQRLATTVGGATRFRSVELAVNMGGGTAGSIGNRFSYKGPATPVTPEYNPYAAFTRLFSDIPSGGNGSSPAAPDPAVERLHAMRRSVLDYVLQDYASVRARVGAADRPKLERHLDSLRDLEKRLVASFGPGALPPPASCHQPAMSGGPDDPADKIGNVHTDLLAMALACDLTRISTLIWSAEADAAGTFPWLGFSENHHDLSHSGPGDTVSRTKLQAIHTWHAGRVAYLADALKAVPEGTGTMLDNTIVLWCSGMAEGAGHTFDNLPFVFVGGGGYFRTGRFVDAAGAPHNKVLVSLCNAMGDPTTSFGNPSFGTGPLSVLM